MPGVRTIWPTAYEGAPPAATRVSLRPAHRLCHRTGWTPITHNHTLSQSVARALGQCRIPINIEDTSPSRHTQTERNSGSLRMNIATGGRCLFKNDDILKTKSILIDLIIPSSCGNTLLDRSAKRSGNFIREAANGKSSKCRRTFPDISYIPPLLTISACGEISRDAHRLIRALVEANNRRVWIHGGRGEAEAWR